MKTLARCLTGLMLGTFSSSLATAATVTGTVKAPDGTAFRGAFVQAQNSATKMTISVLSGRDGSYRIENVPAGSYQLQVRAPGYRADPRDDVMLTANANALHEFALQKGAVQWSDLSQYQGSVLFPAAQGNRVLRGKEILIARCFACHAFQTRMASVKHDANGWLDRVNYMRGA